MNWCEINLARDLIYSSRKRQRVYWMMILYLCAAGCLLAITAGIATQRVLEGFDFHRQALRIEQRFSNTHPSASSMPSYAEDLNQILLSDQNAIEALGQALPEQLHTTLPLIVAILSCPDNGTLHKLSFSQETSQGSSELVFSIRVPLAQRSPPSFIQQWNNDKTLSRQFSSITPVTTHREKIGGEDVLIMSYKAVFRE